MTWEQATAFLLAVSAVLGAFGTVMFQLRGLRDQMNGRLEQLLEHATTAARKDGELAGRDFVRSQISVRELASAAPHQVEPGKAPEIGG